jgi:DNA-binding SARP family transcriptional activator
MEIVNKEGSQLSTHILIHPREYEYQATYRAYLFGPFRLLCGDQPLGELMQRRNKARMILKWFLLNPGKLGSADEFIDLFWPEIPLDKALGNFHVTMHYLRHMLEPNLRTRQESTFIHRKPNNFYWFQMDRNWWLDTSDLGMLLERARECDLHGNDRRAAFYYRKAANYCSQGFLPEDETEKWLLPYRSHYKHTYSQVLIRLIQLYTQWNEWEDVLEYAYQSILSDPYSELAIRAIVDAHLQQGNISIAQHRLDSFWDALHSDLGIRPNKEFHLLRERIRAATN